MSSVRPSVDTPTETVTDLENVDRLYAKYFSQSHSMLFSYTDTNILQT